MNRERCSIKSWLIIFLDFFLFGLDLLNLNSFCASMAPVNQDYALLRGGNDAVWEICREHLSGRMNNRQSDVVPSTSTSTIAMENLKEQSTSTGASAQKVSEVFLAAGQAFQKLGGLIANLHNQKNGVERKWTSSDTNSLHDAVSRFASDLQRISETVQGREVQLMKDDILKRPTASHYVKAISPRISSTTVRPTAIARSLVKRTSSVPHPAMDASFKRRITNTTPSGITVSGNTRYTNITHVQSLNINPSTMSRVKNGSGNVVPSVLTTVPVQPSMPSVVLPAEPMTHSGGVKNFDSSVFNI
ncbi:Chromatin complexes subunit [Dirofilaria immitis]